jgi:hypothetical protein
MLTSLSESAKINNMMVRVKSYTLGKRKDGNYFISLPTEWIEDQSIVKGAKLDFYRDTQDNLVIVPRVAKAKEAV